MEFIIQVLFLAILFECTEIAICQVLSSSSFDLNLLVESISNDLKVVDNLLSDRSVEQIDKFHIQQMKFRHGIIEDASKDLNQFLTNPINEYLLIKRIAEWDDHILATSLNNRMENVTFNSKMNQLQKLANRDEIYRASLNLLRLQVTYRLDTLLLAKGNVSNGANLYLPSHHQYLMNAGECFEMGRHAYLIGEDNYAVEWLDESLRKYETEKEKTASIKDILQFSAFSSYKKGDVEAAINFTQKLIQLLPRGRSQLAEMFEQAETLRAETIEATGQEDLDETYKALCRGEDLMDQKKRDQLYCSYTSSSSAFLKLQPIKQEVVSLHPQLVIFHDIISDREIETIKQLAQPTLKQIKPSSANTGKRLPKAILRQIGNGTVLDIHLLGNSILKRVNRRLMDVTGLFCPSAVKKPLQVLTYGVGGHFSPHCDFIRNNETLAAEIGDSVATLTLYLNDVQVGGSTVFPIAKARVPPSKGSAAFWYNFYSNGNGNPATLHASCPILSGYKWLSVQFFYHRGRELCQQCNSSYESDEIMSLVK